MGYVFFCIFKKSQEYSIIYLYSKAECLFFKLFFKNKKIKVCTITNAQEKNRYSYLYKTIEFKRKSYSVKRMLKLEASIRGVIEKNHSASFYVFGAWSIPAMCLRKNEKSKFVVLENANQDYGITSFQEFSTITLSTGEIFNDCEEYFNSSLFRLKVIKYISQLKNAIFDLELKYVLQRLFWKAVNNLIFGIIKLRSSEERHLSTYIILQISLDAEIACRTTENEYFCLLNKAIPENSTRIIIRPHPKDYTSGWIKFYRRLKRVHRDKEVAISFVDPTDFNCQVALTYSSNWARGCQLKIKKVKFLGRVPELMNSKRPVYLKGILR